MPQTDNRQLLKEIFEGSETAINKALRPAAINGVSFLMERNGVDVFWTPEGEKTLAEIQETNRNRSGDWGVYANGFGEDGEILGRVPGIGVKNES